MHTHSRYAAAFGAIGREIPCVLTAAADECRGPFQCGGFALIGDDVNGKVEIESIDQSSAVLLKNLGAFTMGKNARAVGVVFVAESLQSSGDGTLVELIDEETGPDERVSKSVAAQPGAGFQLGSQRLSVDVSKRGA